MRQSVKVLAARLLDWSGILNRYERQQNSIKVLMLHRVSNANNALGLSITPELFEELVVFLKSRYEIISLEQAVERLANSQKSVGCVLTFDDGYRDNYDCAFPVLKKFKVPATIFVTLDALDTGVFGWDLFDQAIVQTNEESIDLKQFGLESYRMTGTDRTAVIVDLHRALKRLPNDKKIQIVQYVIARYGDSEKKQRTMLTWGEAREMADSGLITIGAHTITHPILSRVDSTQAQYEIITGKSLIEDRLGLPVHYFAYPNGGIDDFNNEHVSMVQQAGYQAACSTISGTNNSDSNLFALRRIDITSRMCTDSAGRFWPSLLLAKTSGLFIRQGA